MIRGLYTAASGMISQQINMDTIANNIANVDTTGYKTRRANFKDLLYTTMEKPGGGNQNVNLQVGSGQRVSSIYASNQPGVLEPTDRKLDMGIEGDGFFVVQLKDGSTAFTRDGNFHASVENGNTYLVTAQGNYVADENGNKIAIAENAEDIIVDSSGNLFINERYSGTKLGMAVFQDPNALEAAGDNLYQDTTGMGSPIQDGVGQVKQGYLEKSNVDLTQEMTRLIQAQRGYQLSSKVIQAADEIESMANHMRA